MPESFKSIDGGAKAGLKLFLKIEKEIGNLRRDNKKSKNPLNEREIVDKAFEFLQKESAYINEGDGTKISRNQAQMLIDLQLILETRVTENLQPQLMQARWLVRQRTKGVKEVKKATARTY